MKNLFLTTELREEHGLFKFVEVIQKIQGGLLPARNRIGVLKIHGGNFKRQVEEVQDLAQQKAACAPQK